MSSVRFFAWARPYARLTETVVLPTPPFWLRMAIFMARVRFGLGMYNTAVVLRAQRMEQKVYYACSACQGNLRPGKAGNDRSVAGCAVIVKTNNPYFPAIHLCVHPWMTNSVIG